MAKYRKKPVVIEAMQFKGVGLEEDKMAAFEALDDWLAKHDAPARWKGNTVVITTLEGEMVGNEGDWIIRGVKGEFYPCRADIFAATYEPAE